MVIPKFSLLKRSVQLRKWDVKFAVMTSSKNGLFVMTSSKKKKKERKGPFFVCFFVDDVISVYIYVRTAPLYWKNFWA